MAWFLVQGIALEGGGGSRPDNSLPGGSGGHPWLPGHGPGPVDPGWGVRPPVDPGFGRPGWSPVDPGFGNRPPVDPGYGRPGWSPVDPGYGRPGGGHPDNSLPGGGHPWLPGHGPGPGGVVYPSHPIYHPDKPTPPGTSPGAGIWVLAYVPGHGWRYVAVTPAVPEKPQPEPEPEPEPEPK